MNREQTLDAALHAVTGRKDDGGKLRYDLEPQDARAGMIGVLTDGAVKYGVRNWEAGMDWSRVYAAAQRHLAAWWAGETHDLDTGRSHLDHAACCIAFLSAYEKRGVGKDDRPAHIAQGSRCVSETASDGKQVAENANANTDPIREPYCGAYEAYSIDVHSCLQCRAQWRADEPRPCQRQDDAEGSDEGWIDHDGSDRCPVTDSEVRLDTKGIEGPATFNVHAAPASGIDWPGVGRWRVSEVDGWRRSRGVKPGRSLIVDLLTRDGRVFRKECSDGWIWRQDGDPGDIIAYRPA